MDTGRPASATRPQTRNISALPCIVLLVNGLAFVGSGVFAFLVPAELAQMAGYSFASSSALGEFWANYGGLYLFYGLFLSWCAFSPARQPVALTVLLFTSLGLATGRLLGTLVASPGVAQLSFLGWELASAVLCVVAMRRLSR